MGAYIKALGLKGYSKGLIDLQTREILGVGEEDYALLFFADIMNDGTASTHANLPAELMHKFRTIWQSK
jgi:hypothetical protein